MSLSRARVIGGCSAHNAAFVVWADRRDYDEWAAPGWEFDAIEPYLRRAEWTIGTRPLEVEEMGPWARAVLDAVPELGIPRLADLNDLSPAPSVAPIYRSTSKALLAGIPPSHTSTGPADART
jgi:choline dehydrogenase